MKQLRLVGRMPVRPARETLTLFTLSAFLFLVVAVWWGANPNARAQQGGRDELRIELTSSGFTPNEVQHAPGTFAIAVENSALSGEYTLRLKAEDGTILQEFRVQKGSSAWTVTLQTGTYTLTETDHPQWTCRIVVQ